jgi:Cysteinyl-tRNA synthetase
MRLYSTLQHELVELPPPPAKVGIYVCGPTVYQRIHVGNARPYVIFLWLRSWLEQRGYEVKLVSNITDVNDKIYAESEREKRASADLAREMSDWYLADTDRLGLGRPDAEPKATEMMVEIVQLITELVGSGHAYEAGGDVYFRVGSYDAYGQLSGQKPDQMSEQEPNPLKEDARDFALWKATKEGEDTS